jgi:hypothetical protein
MYSNPLFEVASEIQTKQKWSISLSDVYCWLDTIARKLLTAQNGRRVCNDIYTSYITESKIDRRDLAAALLFIDLCDAADKHHKRLCRFTIVPRLRDPGSAISDDDIDYTDSAAHVGRLISGRAFRHLRAARVHARRSVVGIGTLAQAIRVYDKLTSSFKRFVHRIADGLGSVATALSWPGDSRTRAR